MTPRISFVVAARNDDHGGNFRSRMQAFVTTLGQLTHIAGIASELVVVEWNPPPDRPRLAEMIEWPISSGLRTIRIVEVPRAVHASFEGADRMPMFEYRAKNVGARRARGEFVLATNPDLVYTPALVQRLAHPLDRSSFFRANRYDIRGVIPQADLATVLAYCRAHTSAVNHRFGTLTVGYPPFGSAGRIWYGALTGRAFWRARRGGLRPLHTNGAGDFFLMARERWHELRGYPELSARSFLDGSLLVLARAAGLRQVILTPPLFHQEHVIEGRPATDYEQGHRRAEPVDYMQHTSVTNPPTWGLGDLELSETVVRS